MEGDIMKEIEELEEISTIDAELITLELLVKKEKRFETLIDLRFNTRGHLDHRVIESKDVEVEDVSIYEHGWEDWFF
jgi:hypothetical protein